MRAEQAFAASSPVGVTLHEPATPGEIVFLSNALSWVVRFTRDGRIEINPELTAEGAAKEFVEIVQRMTGKTTAA